GQRRHFRASSKCVPFPNQRDGGNHDENVKAKDAIKNHGIGSRLNVSFRERIANNRLAKWALDKSIAKLCLCKVHRWLCVFSTRRDCQWNSEWTRFRVYSNQERSRPRRKNWTAIVRYREKTVWRRLSPDIFQCCL